MADELSEALERAELSKETRTVLDLIETMRPEVERSLQSPAAAAQLVQHYYAAVRFNPLLLQCSAESVVAALLLTAQVGLEPGPLGHVYLVPFKESSRGAFNVVWMLGYAGIVELGRRGGAHGLTASVVYEGDDVVRPWQNEKGWHWRLVPAEAAEDRIEPVGVLVSWKEERERVATWCPAERIEAAIKASRNPQKLQLRSEEWYWRKTGVRFARPWLPLTTDAAGAFARAAVADGAAVRELTVEAGEAQPVLDLTDEEEGSTK